MTTIHQDPNIIVTNPSEVATKVEAMPKENEYVVAARLAGRNKSMFGAAASLLSTMHNSNRITKSFHEIGPAVVALESSEVEEMRAKHGKDVIIAPRVYYD